MKSKKMILIRYTVSDKIYKVMHPLEIFNNIISDPDPTQLELLTNSASDDGKYENASGLGKPWENYVKDLIANTRLTKKEEKNKIWKNVFKYQGATNNPPDGLTDCMGYDVKKLEGKKALSLNSSTTKEYLDPNCRKAKKDFKKIAESICDSYLKNHGIKMPFYYIVPEIGSDKKIAKLTIVNGLCLEKNIDGITPVLDAGMKVKEIASKNDPAEIEMLKKVGLLEYAKKLIECEEYGEYKKGEELKYKTKTGGAQRARIMSSTPNPSKITVEVEKTEVDSSTIETEFDFECELIDTEQYYTLLPEDLRKKIENVAKFEKFKHKNKVLDCIRLNLKRKIA